ncbi:hypothetical protein [Phenylobacterium deserti]|uniref:Uncharacterized protein n=1 Tax=Phenylobacterium deserti TaxID=1914756 RepID=A0A328AQB8_9CAUL|nr:hypothetical protein [Phenylobacterium deserti]RAK56545.1 hypothetical protein DJ018_00750 [Phenylobacterium deserti]
MQTYRAYKLNPSGRIAAGEWLHAETLAEAKRLAHAMCDSATPAVELWQGATRLAVIPCADEEVAA